ncbi:MAG: endonuclease/exonuclease/phosphatase family protein [Rubripirellula sp.]
MAANLDETTDANPQTPTHSVARIAWTIVWFALFAALGSTALSLFAAHHWLADLVANLRLQQVIAAVAILSVFAWKRKTLACVIAIAIVLVHLPWFGAALPQSNHGTPASDADLIITFANVLTSNHQHDAVMTDLLHRDPDVIAVAELGSPLAKKLAPKLASSHPHQVSRPEDLGNFGIALYSRYPFSNKEVFDAAANEIDSITATIEIGDPTYRLYVTHPLPPMGPENFASRNTHLKGIADHVQNSQTQNPRQSVVLVGDLNLTPWSPWFERLEEGSGLHRANPNFSLTPTWYRYDQFAFGLILDHCLISSDLNCTFHETGPDMGSDHRSITVGVTPVAKPTE